MTDEDFVILPPKFNRQSKKVDDIGDMVPEASITSIDQRSSSSELDDNIADGDIEMGGVVTNGAVAAAAMSTSVPAASLNKNATYADDTDDFINSIPYCQPCDISNKKKAPDDGHTSNGDESGGGNNNSDRSGDDENELDGEDLDEGPCSYLLLPSSSLKKTSKSLGANDDNEEGRKQDQEQKDRVEDQDKNENEEEMKMKAVAIEKRSCVDKECSICLSDYEVGDQVVWSPLDECPHAFHKDCLMQWLTKGKKRCPLCRNWFVPGKPIKEQIIELQQEQEEEEVQQEAQIQVVSVVESG